jgi:murein DD-endopeptidase MepM/ murein hydrolase activator NlpD
MCHLRIALRAAFCATLVIVVLVTVRESSSEASTTITVSSPRAVQPVDPDIERALLDREKRVSRSSARRAARPAPVAQEVVIEPITWTSPLSGYRLTGRFGDRSSMWSSGMHTGLDFAAPSGTPIRSIAAGVVKKASYDGAYGYKTVVSLKGGGEVWYCHQSRLAVRKGQRLAPGQVLGYVGYTGNVTGAHLHMEIRYDDRPVDPAAVLARQGVGL